jgi:hypothetical protein
MFLHEAIAAILERHPLRRAHRSELAIEISELGLYFTRSGRPASAKQISARVSKHPRLFHLYGCGMVGLR